MRTATKRSLLSLVAVSGLVLGLLPAAAQTTSLFKGAVDVRNVLAGTGNKEFKITVTRTATNPTEAAVNAVVVNVPAAFTLREGRATGWTATTLSPRAVFFTGGTIPASGCSTNPNPPTNLTTCSGVFSIFADVPAASQDVTSRWSAGASTNGGDNFTEVPPDGAGAMDTVTRVLQVTSLGITAPAGATDNSVTAQQNNVDAVCAIQNVGTAALSVTASLDGASSSAATKSIAPGATETFGFRFNAFDDVDRNTTQSKTCSGSAANAQSTGFNKSLSLAIQPRPTFEYVQESLSPQATAPLATPNFQIQVNKFQARPVPANQSDASPAVTLDPARTDFTILSEKGNIGPTPLGSDTTVGAGEREEAVLQFASLTIPAACTPTLQTNCVEDKNYNIRVNVGGTDANGAPIELRPLPQTNDLIRIDAAIPVLTNHRLTAPASRCCDEDPAVKNGDALNISANVTDRDPMGATLPCGTCEVVLSELVQFAGEGGGTEVGQRIPVPLTIDETGTISGTYTGDYSPLAKSTQHFLIVRDSAGNRSDAGTGTPDKTSLIPVDNLAPTILSAAATPAPTVASQDLQRLLTIQFSESVDNFNQPVDGVCPQTDWRTDNNTVLSCARDTNFRSAGLTVANELPPDTPGTTLQYFPQTPLSFHDRVGNPIAAGTTVPVLDRIPPKAPSFSTVAGRTADAGDGKYYTRSSNPAFVLTGAQAVVPGYTVQLWREDNGKSGLQIEADPGDPTTTEDDIAADQKIGESVVQQGQSSVTVTPTVELTGGNAQAGFEHKVYARSLDTASPANGTNLDTVRSALVVVDKVAPALADTATASANGIEVKFNEAVIGRNSAIHWEVLDTGGDRYVIGGVEGSGDGRLVRVADARYCANVGCAVRPASIQYLFFGQASDRYQDKAGNVVADKKAGVVLLIPEP